MSLQMLFLEQVERKLMFDSLNAGNHKNNVRIVGEEFKSLLGKIVLCYKMMIESCIKLPNKENDIRDILLIKYLKNNEIRKKIELSAFLFDREVPEDRTKGRTDIKIQTKKTFVNQDAYYIIECKRLNNKNLKGITGLNGEYVKNGILRFTTSCYSSYYNVNGMIGFLVEEINIDANIDNLNTIMRSHLGEKNVVQDIQKDNLKIDFNYYYTSKHKVQDKELKLHHLMFDFSKNMEKA